MASRELNLQGMLLRRRYLDFGRAKQQIEKEAVKRVPGPAWPVNCRSDGKMIGVSEGAQSRCLNLSTDALTFWLFFSASFPSL
jgi:hypothetical protein